MTRSSRAAGVVGFDPTTDPMAPSAYVIQAIVDGLDEIARGMERKWGVGRLRLLVSDLLRSKFDAQKDKLDADIWLRARDMELKYGTQLSTASLKADLEKNRELARTGAKLISESMRDAGRVQ